MSLGQNTSGRDLKVRYLYLGAFMLAGLFLLGVNLYRLQIVRGDEFLAKSQDNFVKMVRLKADRGMIKDARGELLVDGRPSFDVQLTPAFCQRCVDDVLPRLAGFLKWDEATLSRISNQIKGIWGPARFQPVTVRVDLSRDELDVISAHLHSLPGVDVMPVPHRSYRNGSTYSHLIGYLNEISQEELERLNSEGGDYVMGDYIGRNGLEKSFEWWLRGKDGSRKDVVDARGRPWCNIDAEQEQRCTMGLLDDEDTIPPRPGNNLILSIDARLQAVAEEAFPATGGAVVAVDVQTGFLLVYVSRPAVDPNLLTGRVSGRQLANISRDPLQPMVSRIAGQHYSPGSTFKVFSLLAALESNVFNSQSAVYCPGGYRLGSRVWRCHKDSGHGMVDARRALQVSCDTYFYKVADTLGIDAISRVAKDFGFGTPTQMGVVSEVAGIMPDTAYHDRVTPGGYTKGMALNTAIGQGDVNVTPLQLVMSYAALANGGKLLRPQVVKRVESPEGRVLKEFVPDVLKNHPMKEEHRQVVLDALMAVVNEAGGTAYRSRVKGVSVAGKTGTAQVAKLGQVRLKTEEMSYFTRDHAWFAAFAPVENPRIAVVVLNEHGGHGGSDAAPTAAAVLAKYFELNPQSASLSDFSDNTQRLSQVSTPHAH